MSICKKCSKKRYVKKSGHRQRQQGSPADAESRTKNPRSDSFGASLSESICRSKTPASMFDSMTKLKRGVLYVYNFQISEFYDSVY